MGFKMKIEALEPIRSGAYSLSEGDQMTVADDVGSHWCMHGWARDLAGIVPTGTRRVISAIVNPAAGTASSAASEA